MSGFNMIVRRWCERCQDFTNSRLTVDGTEVCSRCCPAEKYP